MTGGGKRVVAVIFAILMVALTGYLLWAPGDSPSQQQPDRIKTPTPVDGSYRWILRFAVLDYTERNRSGLVMNESINLTSYVEGDLLPDEGRLLDVQLEARSRNGTTLKSVAVGDISSDEAKVWVNTTLPPRTHSAIITIGEVDVPDRYSGSVCAFDFPVTGHAGQFCINNASRYTR